MTANELVKLLETHGWQVARQNGSHRIYRHSEKPVNISVPFHGKKDLKIGTLKQILKKAGLP